MKRASLTIFILTITTAQAFIIDKKYSGKPLKGKVTEKKYLEKVFRLVESPFSQERVITDPLHLQQAARDTLAFISSNKKSYQQLITPQAFAQSLISTEHMKETLKYIIDTIEHDKEKGAFRIQNPDFLNKQFSFVRWWGDHENAKKNKNNWAGPGTIHISHYPVYCISGSYKKSDTYNCALYWACGSRPLPFTKQEVMKGVLDRAGNASRVKPLAWLTRQGLEDAMMQGTIMVKMPDKKIRGFKVHVHNGIAYDKTIRDQQQQGRYWYFKELPKKHVLQTYKRCQERKGVIFAGDVKTIGLGKVIALQYYDKWSKQHRIQLGVLADTGAAFNNNLYQLDCFAGISSGLKALRQEIKHVPNATKAYLVYRSTKHSS